MLLLKAEVQEVAEMVGRLVMTVLVMEMEKVNLPKTEAKEEKKGLTALLDKQEESKGNLYSFFLKPVLCTSAKQVFFIKKSKIQTLYSKYS
jgi:mannose/fructose/N-acetylgalactosamine-specific phosphotransferase system component IID